MMQMDEAGSWSVCEELDQESKASADHPLTSSKRTVMVTFDEKLAHYQLHHSQPDSGDYPKNRERFLRSAGDGESSLRRHSLLISASAPLPRMDEVAEQDQECGSTHHSTNVEPPRAAADGRPRHRQRLIMDEEEDNDEEGDDVVHEQMEVLIDDEEEVEHEETREEDEEDEEGGELVDDEQDEAERATEIAEQLAPFSAAVEHLLTLLDDLNTCDPDQQNIVDKSISKKYQYRRSRVVAVADGLRQLKQTIDVITEPLSTFCPDNVADLRLALRSLSNAISHLLNGVQVMGHITDMPRCRLT